MALSITDPPSLLYSISLARLQLDEAGVQAVVNVPPDWTGGPYDFYIQIDPADGAINKLSPTATPYPHRGQNYMSMQMHAVWSEMTDDYPVEFTKESINTITPHAKSAGQYINYIDCDLGSMEGYFGQNAQQVSKLIKEQDPNGRFASGTCNDRFA